MENLRITSVSVKRVVRGEREMFRLNYTMINEEGLSNKFKADFFDIGDPIIFDESSYNQFVKKADANMFNQFLKEFHYA